MKRMHLLAGALSLGGLLIAGNAWGHGGSFRGPNGSVPPGLREPADPEPPPPPPSDPPTPGSPTTPTGPAPGPETPRGGQHEPDTGGGGATPPGPSQRPGGKPVTNVVSFDSWRFWWAYNSDDILNLKRHVHAGGPDSYSPVAFASGADEENRIRARWPTQREVERAVIPALLRCVNRPRDHEDIHGGALVALGKLGASRYLALFQDAIWNRYRTPRGARIDFGYQATESAVLALGLLPALDASQKSTVREILLAALHDPGLRTRERTWAAVGLGLQRDADAVRPLVEALRQRYPDDNVPAGILAGLGLIGDCAQTRAILPELRHAFERGQLFGRDISGADRVRSFVGYALAKIGNPEALPTIHKVLLSRRAGRIVKRAAAIAAGVLGAKANAERKEETVRTLLRYLRRSGGDPSGENFALIALSQIGTERALDALLDVAANGKYNQRPFAALGLATHVYYRQHAGDLDAELRRRIVRRLRELSHRYKDTETRAAFMLARGLVKDASAADDLIEIVAHRGTDPRLRGTCCVSLGLLGDARGDIKEAIRLALGERRSPDLRRDAATGLGLLRDAAAVGFLVRELRRAKSFAVQGQLITAIGTIGDHTALAPLIRLLDDPSQPAQTRAMAAVGLGMIGDPRELPALGRLAKNYNYRASVADLDELLFIL
ncbi:MAG: HEAT repeat domain-containing protein [Planctomycetota bacterium]|jgi:HEAT repeat protein